MPENEATVVTSDPSLMDGKTIEQVTDLTPDVEVEQAPEGEGGTESPPAIDYAAEVGRLKKDRERLEFELSPYRQREREYEDQQLARLVDSFLNPTPSQDIDGEKAAPIRPNVPQEDAQHIRQLVQAGATFIRDLPNIRQERISGLAINYAHDVVGDNVPVKELTALATEFVKLEDPRLMERWRDKLINERRTSARGDRIATGVDRPVSSGVGATRLSDPEVIGQKIVEKGVNSLSQHERQTYARWRRDKGLPVPAGWL